MTVDCFLKIDGIQGESTDPKQETRFEKKDAVMAGFAAGKVRVQRTIDPESRKASDDDNGIAAIQRRCRAGPRDRCVDEGSCRRIGRDRTSVV